MEVTGDTSWTPALLQAAAGTDVFACEAYTYDRPVPFHLDYEDVAAHADELDTGRLVLTHMGPTVLERLGSLDRETACDGLVVVV